MMGTEKTVAAAGAAVTTPFALEQDAAIRTGQAIGVSIRTVLRPDSPLECAVSVELGVKIIEMVLEYAEAEREKSAQQIIELEAKIAERKALAGEKGGQQL